MNEKPNFSGEWILDRQACTLSPGADAMRTGVVRIEHREPKFQYKGEFMSDTGTAKAEFELMAEEREDASLRWDGNALVFTYADEHMNISFRYELMDAGRRLRAVEKLRASDRSQDNIWIFDRQ